MRSRIVLGVIVTGALLALPAGIALPVRAASTTNNGPACGEKVFTNPQGMQIRVLWAKNGAVQRYVVVDSKGDPEGINDMKLDLEKSYGPEGADAPPLRIVSFKPGENGMMIPDKAVDSCGRTLSFQ